MTKINCAVKVSEKKDNFSLLNEYLILRLLKHKNIVKVYDYFEVQEKEYMFFELCETDLF